MIGEFGTLIENENKHLTVNITMGKNKDTLSVTIYNPHDNTGIQFFLNDDGTWTIY